jgi:hypothetical protein
MLHFEVYHDDFRVSLVLPLLFSRVITKGRHPATLGLIKRKGDMPSCGYGVVALPMTIDDIRLPDATTFLQ